jgi:hypothetical protein
MQIALPVSVLIVFLLVSNAHHVHNVQVAMADSFCQVLNVLIRAHMVSLGLTEFAKDVLHLVTIVLFL